MGFRSILRRARKPVVMALVAGSLALSLTVTTTQKAEAVPAVAVLPVIAAAESVLAGGVAISMPSVLAVSMALHPVGWAIGLGALGLGLWASKDYWLPWVQDPAGSWGKATGQSPSSPAGPGAVNPYPALSTTGTSKATETARDVRITASDGAPQSNGFIGWAVNLSCKHVSTGVVVKRSANVLTSQHLQPTKTADAYCPTGETPVGGVVGAYGSAPELAAATQTTPGSYRGPANVFRWGDQLGTATPGFDPRGADVKYKTSSECIDAAGNKSTVTAESFGNEGGVKFASCEAAGKGHGTGNNSLVGTAPGTTTETPLWETSPQPDPNQPLCDPQRPGSGCKMAITIDGKPCTVGSWDCENWTEIWKDPTTAPRVGCTYGPYAMAVDLCRVMEPAYRPGGAPSTEENMDGEPATRNYTQPGGTTYAPPSTGTGTVPGGAAAGAPAGSTPEQAQCFASGWGLLNPVEWVMKPVGCAMAAAFEPKKDLQTRLTSMQGQFSNKVPISWFGVGVEGVSGGTCPTSWQVSFKGESYSLICGTTADGIIRSFRPVLGAMLIMAALWPLIRSLFYSAIPVFKVNPS